MMTTFDIKGKRLESKSNSVYSFLLFDPLEVIRFMRDKNYIGNQISVSEKPFSDDYFIIDKLEKSDDGYHMYQVTKRKFWFFKQKMKFEICDRSLCNMLNLYTPPEKLYVKAY